MINPYFVYFISFFFVFIVYQLDWSYYYPELGFPLVAFFIFTFIFCIPLAFFFKKIKLTKFYTVPYDNKLFYLTILIWIGYLVEFVYQGIPLFNSNIQYKDFGIPTFHVILVTFQSFITVYLSHVILSEKNTKNKRKYWVLFLINLIPPLLIVNRGMIIFNLLSSVFIFMFKKKALSVKKILNLSLICLICMYLFGLIGNVRMNKNYSENNNIFNTSLILNIGGATNSFKHSIIPKPYFWTYIYIASPLGNLQNNINKTNEFTKKNSSILDFINSEFIPDFISKRISKAYNFSGVSVWLVRKELNVSTTFAEAFSMWGWFGMLLMFLYILIFPLIYLYILYRLKSQFFLTGLSILCTMYLFLPFSNMLVFSGLSFQLVYPLIFSFVKIFKRKNSTVKKEVIYEYKNSDYYI